MLKTLEFVSNTYLAFTLDEKSRQMLLAHWKPRFADVRCHHVTIERDVTAERLSYVKDLFGYNDPHVYVTGIRRGAVVEAFSAIVNGESVRPDGKSFHITLSVEPPHQAVEANNLLGTVTLHEFFFKLKLSGSFELLPQS